MDLVAGIRKEGSRGGRSEFKWTDVQSSQHRENYLGHSVMAPVGRWQQGRDLQWYSKNGTSADMPSEPQRASERQQEIQRVKDAENDALNKALGYSPGSILQTASLGSANNLCVVDSRGDQKFGHDRGRLDNKAQEQRQRIHDQSRDRVHRRRRSRSPDYNRRRRDGDRMHSKRQRLNGLSESTAATASRRDRLSQSRPLSYSRSPSGRAREGRSDFKSRSRREQYQSDTKRLSQMPTDDFGRRRRERSRSPDY